MLILWIMHNIPSINEIVKLPVETIRYIKKTSELYVQVIGCESEFENMCVCVSVCVWDIDGLVSILWKSQLQVCKLQVFQ